MNLRIRSLLLLTVALPSLSPAELRAQSELPGTQPLTLTGVPADKSTQMVTGIGRFLDREIAVSEAARAQYWRPDYSNREAYEKSVQPNRDRFIQIIGAIDARLASPEMEYIATTEQPAKVAETDHFIAYAVRWPVFEGVEGEGLLLEPKGTVAGQVVVIPDADQLPEVVAGLAPGLPDEAQCARRLAENGYRVVIPTLVDRSDTFSGHARITHASTGNGTIPFTDHLFTNQPHREWIYRQSYTLGRHIIGYEVQKVLAAVDWFSRQNRERPLPIGVVGWGEGGLLAFYSAALDRRIDAVLVSGYFAKRERVWDEPIYRNVFGLLREFGDAEIARMIVPRKLLIEYSVEPDVAGPPPETPDRKGAAPGRIVTPEFSDVAAEIARARDLSDPFRASIRLVSSGENDHTVGPMAEETLLAFMQSLHPGTTALAPPGRNPVELRSAFDPVDRQHRQVAQLEHFTQSLIGVSRGVRQDLLWKTPITTPAAWEEAMRPFRAQLWDEVFGRIPRSEIPLNVRSQKVYDKPTWTGYEVILDVAPDFFAWGYLLLPKDLKPGEKRPVVVAQHGLHGVPTGLIDDRAGPTARPMNAWAARLVEQGFIVFVPHFPWRAGDRYRVLQRKANPLGQTVISLILAEHERILDWLTALPSVDPTRIGLYGLSWGGKVAIRVPALLERYRVAVCAGDFNEWIWKTATTDWMDSYMFADEYEMGDFRLGLTFGHAEMAALIAPRPFMVERGHWDVVSTDEWVSFEYAKVRRLYDELGIPDRTQIEYFNGPHQVHGVGTFAFLHRELNWPESKP